MRDEFDYIVVGAGSAGCAVAYRLSERRDLRVLVLEAGGRDWSPYLQIPAGRIRMSDRYDWAYPAIPDPSREGTVEPWEAGKVLGGSSTINGMFWVRGTAADYDGWAALGCEGWDYASVLPYFKRSESFEGGADEFRGDRGPQHVSYLHLHHHLTDEFLDAAEAAGFPRLADYNGSQQYGAGYGQVSQRRGLRHSTARAYLAPAMRRRNLTVRTNAFVRRVLVERGKAVGVEYEHGGVISRVGCRREVVLSGGALASPKLLLVSGIGPAAQLDSLGVGVVQDLPGVGQNLQNHFGVTLLHEVDVPTLNREINPRNVVKHGLDLVLRGRGAATSAFGHAVIFGRVRGGDGLDFEATFSPFGRFTQKENGRGRHKLQLTQTNSVTTRIGLTHPRSRGEVALHSADPSEPPLIRHEFASVPEDIEDLRLACEQIRAVIATSPIGDHLVGELVPGSETSNPEAWERFIRRKGGSKHPAGSCKMGVDDLAVVDPRLRVRGVEALRVMDLSITPLITSGNTNATAIMIGERGADLLLDDAPSGARRASAGATA